MSLIGCAKTNRPRTYLVYEHLVDMCVNGDANILSTWHKVRPVTERLECVVYEGDYVALLAVGIA
jgi:hypothetical protein